MIGRMLKEQAQALFSVQSLAKIGVRRLGF